MSNAIKNYKLKLTSEEYQALMNKKKKKTGLEKLSTENRWED